MKKKLIALLIFFLLSACAAPTPANVPKAADTQIVIPTRMPFPTRISKSPISPEVTPTLQSGLLEGVKFVAKFSSSKADWQILPGSITPAQINAEVARQEGDEMRRVNQKVLNGFVRVTVTQVGGQVFEALAPAEVVNGRLKELKVKNVGQTPVLATRAVLLEDYFAINFPDMVEKWQAQGAPYEDFKYAAIITVTWATKYGPLRISYKLSGKYINEEGKYPGRVDFLKLCAYESTEAHYLPTGKLTINWYPAPIIGLSGTTLQGVSGKMDSDAFGWTPITDFAQAESATLSQIGQAVSGVAIESKETLAELQALFDRVFFPVHCGEVAIE